MNCSMPGLPIHHQLPEFTQSHVHWQCQWCHSTISSSGIPFSCLQSFPKSGSFPMSQFFTSGGQSIGVSALASVPPMNTQDWSPLEGTGWITLQSKGLSTVFSNTTVQSCPLLFDPMDCSLPGSSVHGMLQVRILGWLAISFSRESSQTRDQTWVSCIAGRFFTFWVTRERNVVSLHVLRNEIRLKH